jgi:tRNA threonylcarbamoyladenosine biosynthesis protein TsaB
MTTPTPAWSCGRGDRLAEVPRRTDEADGNRGPILVRMQVVLGIETATTSVGVAVVELGGPLRARIDIGPSRRHAETIAPSIEFLLAQVGCALTDVACVAVDIGPGLFTGLRVGIAAAAGLAYAIGCPAFGVTSTTTVATAVANQVRPGERVAVVLDARRRELYAAVPGLLEPFVGTPANVAKQLSEIDEPLFLVGEGIHLLGVDSLPLTVRRGTALPPDPLVVAGLGAAGFAAGQAVGPEALVPLYLRAPDAQITWDTRFGAAVDREPDRVTI